MTDISTLDAYTIIFKDYPDVVNVAQMTSMLEICNKKVYQLIHSGVIPTIPCCKCFKIAKLSVIEYLLSSQFVA